MGVATDQGRSSARPHKWIERNGGPEPITPRFTLFLEAKMSGRSLDLDGDKEMRPDYACLGGALVIEIKSLESDPSERLSNALAPAKESESWPEFFGQWPMEAILKNLPEDERGALRKSLGDRLGRAIVTHMKKANGQIANYEKKNEGIRLRLLVLINEDFIEYDPAIVIYIVQTEFRRQTDSGEPRYSNIDAAVFLTERHATNVNGQVTFPISIIHGPGIEENPVALELLRRLVSRWASSSAGREPLDVSADFTEFVPIHENPKQMRRSELWEQEYRRKPYMRDWKDEDVIGLWDVTTLMTLLAFHVDPPMKVPQEGIKQLMEQTTHLMKEFASRGIALDRIKPKKQRNEAAISKITYGPIVQEWLRKQVEHIQ